MEDVNKCVKPCLLAFAAKILKFKKDRKNNVSITKDISILSEISIFHCVKQN